MREYLLGSPFLPAHQINRPACLMSVGGFSDNRFKGYTTLQAAEDAWNHGNAAGIVGPLPKGPKEKEGSKRMGSQHDSYPVPVATGPNAFFVVLKGLKPGVYQTSYVIYHYPPHLLRARGMLLVRMHCAPLVRVRVQSSSSRLDFLKLTESSH